MSRGQVAPVRAECYVLLRGFVFNTVLCGGAGVSEAAKRRMRERRQLLKSQVTLQLRYLENRSRKILIFAQTCSFQKLTKTTAVNNSYLRQLSSQLSMPSCDQSPRAQHRGPFQVFQHTVVCYPFYPGQKVQAGMFSIPRAHQFSTAHPSLES